MKKIPSLAMQGAGTFLRQAHFIKFLRRFFQKAA
jgi:hypothetical protein